MVPRESAAIPKNSKRAPRALYPTGAKGDPYSEGVGTGGCAGPWLLDTGEKKKVNPRERTVSPPRERCVKFFRLMSYPGTHFRDTYVLLR